MKLHKQYDYLKSEKAALLKRISNLWIPMYFIVHIMYFFSVGFLLGFSFEELTTSTEGAKDSSLLEVIVIASIPLAAWLAWGIACLPFISKGKLCVDELKIIMLKLEYPTCWLDNDL
ncbi:hypothetical protein [Hahella chejuensis]|uniref:hypothetical protein n=1 Tax=Hahella chejuensis TaxID=158327 RepID=UPI0005A10A95|nr:hypothetical protein [Hahella chejuensis]